MVRGVEEESRGETRGGEGSCGEEGGDERGRWEEEKKEVGTAEQIRGIKLAHHGQIDRTGGECQEVERRNGGVLGYRA